MGMIDIQKKKIKRMWIDQDKGQLVLEFKNKRIVRISASLATITLLKLGIFGDKG